MRRLAEEEASARSAASREAAGRHEQAAMLYNVQLQALLRTAAKEQCKAA